MPARTFRGSIAEFYAQFRRGYPPAVIDRLAATLDLDGRSRVLDIGCGTGQLTLPLAARTRSVLGVDVEADMLQLARSTARDAGVTNTAWMLAADTELDVLVPLAGEHEFDAATIGQALHWMDAAALFRTLRRLLRPGGGVAVVTNGEPQWLLDAPWSRTLRRHLETWMDRPLTARCGTDPSSRRAYRQALDAAGFERIDEVSLRYSEDLTFAHLVGSVYSAMSPETLPRGTARETFEHQLRTALGDAETFHEDVRVSLVVGRNAAPLSRHAHTE